jgi:hypothetical protein
MEAAKRSKSSSTLVLLVLVLFVILFVFFIYTFLHEAGHAIVGLLFGRSLTEFNVNFWDFSAHVGMVGGELTQSQLALQSVAGASLPLFVWAVFMSLVPRKSSFLVEALKLVSAMGTLNTLLTWMILPVLFLLDKAPSDDVTYFLCYSQMPPLLLVLIAFVLYTGGWLLFLSRIDGLRNQFLLFRITDPETLTRGSRRTIPVLASVISVCILTAFILNGFAATHPVNPFTPPQGFETIAQIDLSKQAYPSETLAQFTLDESTYVGVFIALQDIDTTYFDIHVTGPDGFTSTVMHGEGYNATQDGGLWEQNLMPGSYQLILNSHQSPGTVSVYLKVY